MAPPPSHRGWDLSSVPHKLLGYTKKKKDIYFLFSKKKNIFTDTLCLDLLIVKKPLSMSFVGRQDPFCRCGKARGEVPACLCPPVGRADRQLT